MPNFTIGTDQLKDFRIVTDQEAAIKVAQTLDHTSIFSLDLETTGLDYNRSITHGIALATDTAEWYVCLGAEKYMFEYLQELVKTRQVIMHNASFDMHFLRRNNVEVPGIIDTMVAQHLIDENQGLGLKDLSYMKLNAPYNTPSFKDLLHWAKVLTGKSRLADVSIYDIPLSTLGLYAGLDVRYTYDLWQVSQYELANEGMEQIFWENKMPMVHVIQDMEEQGFVIDQQNLKKVHAEFVEARDAAAERFMEITDGVSPTSTQQLAHYFYSVLSNRVTKRTPGGQPSVDVLALKRLGRLKKNEESVRALNEFKLYDKLISTYVEKIGKLMVNGRLYGSFTMLPVTGRLNSSDPNLQNIPGRGDTGSTIRSLFTVAPGFDFVSADYSQLEMRILAHFSKDPALLELFNIGGDPHQTTIDRMLEKGYELTRTQAKALNFGWAYLISAMGLMDDIEVSTGIRPKKAEAQGWLNGYSKAYPVADRWRGRVIQYATELGYSKSIAGRKRRLPDLRSPQEYERSRAQRQAVNYVIQGSAADIMDWALIRIHKVAKEFGVGILAQVHDEINSEAPEDVSHEYAGITGGIMVEAGEHFDLRVPLVVEPKIGKNWAEVK